MILMFLQVHKFWNQITKQKHINNRLLRVGPSSATNSAHFLGPLHDPHVTNSAHFLGPLHDPHVMNSAHLLGPLHDPHVLDFASQVFISYLPQGTTDGGELI